MFLVVSGVWSHFLILKKFLLMKEQYSNLKASSDIEYSRNEMKLNLNNFPASTFSDVLENHGSVHELDNNSQLTTMELKFNEEKNKLKSHGPTSKLWIQYVNMIDIFKSNIRADRISEFLNHRV